MGNPRLYCVRHICRKSHHPNDQTYIHISVRDQQTTLIYMLPHRGRGRGTKCRSSFAVHRCCCCRNHLSHGKTQALFRSVCVFATFPRWFLLLRRRRLPGLIIIVVVVAGVLAKSSRTRNVNTIRKKTMCVYVYGCVPCILSACVRSVVYRFCVLLICVGLKKKTYFGFEHPIEGGPHNQERRIISPLFCLSL